MFVSRDLHCGRLTAEINAYMVFVFHLALVMDGIDLKEFSSFFVPLKITGKFEQELQVVSPSFVFLTVLSNFHL